MVIFEHQVITLTRWYRSCFQFQNENDILKSWKEKLQGMTEEAYDRRRNSARFIVKYIRIPKQPHETATFYDLLRSFKDTL